MRFPLSLKTRGKNSSTFNSISVISLAECLGISESFRDIGSIRRRVQLTTVLLYGMLCVLKNTRSMISSLDFGLIALQYAEPYKMLSSFDNAWVH